MNISEFSVKRPITTLMIILSVLVLGSLGLQRLPLTFYPEISSQSLRINIPYPSSSPQEVERLIARPVEEIMGTLPNLERMSSTSAANNGNISLEFKSGTDMDLAAMEVRDRLDRVRAQLPDDVDRVFIFRWQTSDRPIYEFSVAWNRSKDELHEAVQKEIIPRLQRIDGVANVETRGIDERQVLVQLDQARMRAHHVDFFDLSQSLRTNNANVSGGWVIDAGRKFTVRSIGEFQTVEEIAKVPIRGTKLVLGDVAKISYDFPEQTNFQRLNKSNAVVLRVYKASTANVIDVARRTKSALEAIKTEPEFAGLQTQNFRDQSTEILDSLKNLAIAGIFGGILATIMLYVFLRKFRSTVIISLAIPISIMATFFIMYIARLAPFNSEITLNLVSLSGLMFAVGMLVDPAVVVLENIFRHKQEEGLDAHSASIVGAKEVSVAVVSASMTTIIVFVPLIFMNQSGFGRFMVDFGIAIVSATIASMIMSLTLIPLAASRLFTGKEKPKAKLIQRMSDVYGTAISTVTRFPYSLIAVAVLLSVAYGAWWLQSQIDRAWMPSTPAREMRLDVELDRNFSIQQVAAIFDSVENILLNNKEELEIATISTNYSKRRSQINIFFVPEEDGQHRTADLYNMVRDKLPVIAGAEFKVGRMMGRGGGDMGVSVELKGKSTEVLMTYVEEVRAMLEGIEGVKDINTSMERGDEEVSINVDRVRAQKYGLSSQQVASTISSALSSRANSKFKAHDREVDILVQLAEEDRVNLQQLETMALQNTRGEMVQLGSVANLDVKKGPEAITREDRQTTITIFANTEQSGMWKVSREIDQRMASVELPPGYSWSKGRNWQMMQQSEQDSNFAIILAIILVYIIMASLFESFIHPFTIMFSVPFALIGVFLMFWFTNTNLTTMANLGILVVCGLVVNNGIILIDAINKLRRSGVPRTEAIRIGGRNRLRPILMTTLTTILGLLPLVVPAMFPEIFGPQEGRSGMYAPVGLAVVGGLVTSTPLTLFLMPIFYVYFDNLAIWASKVTARVYRMGRREAVVEA